MGKAACTCPPKAKGGKGGKKSGGNRHANMFILFFLDTWRKEGGNMYCVAKCCGQRWRTLPQAVKDKYKRQYCAKCKLCKSCTRSVMSGGKAARGGKGGKAAAKKC